jgi:hypothetical protein
MVQNMSLAEQAVQALAMVKAMDEGLDMEHPERHSVRSMKRVAEQLIAAGLRHAIDLAWQAQDLRKLAIEIAAPAKGEAKQTTCSYPHCNCPFDAPADPNWCARGLPHNALANAPASAGD